MDFRPDMDAHLAAKKRQYARQRKRAKTILVLLLCITILASWVLIGVIALRLMGAPYSPTHTVTTPALTTDSEAPASTTTAVPVTTVAPEYDTLLVEKGDITSGTLILVSSMLGRAYDFDKEPTMITLYGNKPNSYRIANTSLKLEAEAFHAANQMFNAYQEATGNRDYQITHAARTLDQQKSIYDHYLATYGTEEGALLAAQPGYSEHHSGYAFDMNVYTAGGVSYSLASASDVDPNYGWIYENAAKYGFVQRYPEGKTSLTGITNEPWHFRYVGRGHASYMAENGLVLEEYIALLYKHPHDGKHLTFAYDGVSYEVFFVPFAEGVELVEVQIPKGAEYTISGNNWDGVIVTVYP